MVSRASNLALIEAADLPEDVLALLDHYLSTSPAPTATPGRATRSSTTSYAIDQDQGEGEIVVYNRPSCCSRPIARR